MKKLFFLLFISSLHNSCSVAQVTSSTYAGNITEESAKRHLTTLTSKEFAGRGTGQEGGKKTVNYVTDHFKKIGLKPAVNGTYQQPLALIKTSYKVEHFNIESTKLTNGVDIYVQGNHDFQSFSADEVIFVGYGIQDTKYNEVKGVDVKGKVILLINEGEPLDKAGNSAITGSKIKSDWTTNRFKKIQQLIKLQPKLILATGKEAEETIKRMNNRNLAGRFELDKGSSAQKKTETKSPVVYITEKVANNILQKQQISLSQFKEKTSQTLSPITLRLPVSVEVVMGIKTEKLNDPNVIGWLEGSDLKEEYVIICGHYDHDGMLPDGTYFPGADDNGSGTVAVLELAQAFAKAKKEGRGPRRSMVFIALAAEERGLLGSQYYVENPIFALNKTVACINIDMIGRIDDKHLNGNHNYIHVIGVNKLSTELKPIVEKANTQSQMELDYSYDRPDEPMRLYYRSDHYNFAKNQIPSLFFFSGLHPHYHTPEDTVDKIDFPMMVKREKLIFETAWDIANRDKRPAVDLPL